MKFIDIVWAAFFARVNPVSTIAKPACMNMTRNPARSVQTKLMAILLWPTVSITSVRVGFFGSLTGTSAAVPVVAPVGSPFGWPIAPCACTVAGATKLPIMRARSAVKTDMRRRFARLFISSPFLESDVRNAPTTITGLRDVQQMERHRTTGGNCANFLGNPPVSTETSRSMRATTLWIAAAEGDMNGGRDRSRRSSTFDKSNKNGSHAEVIRHRCRDHSERTRQLAR